MSGEYPLHHKTIFKIGNSVMYMAKRCKVGFLDLDNHPNL